MGGVRTGGVRFLSYGVAGVFAFPAPSHFIGVSGGAVFASLCVVVYSFEPILLMASALTGAGIETGTLGFRGASLVPLVLSHGPWLLLCASVLRLRLSYWFSRGP